MPDNAEPVLYTVGHSNYTFERFLELLRQHGIDPRHHGAHGCIDRHRPFSYKRNFV